jgi:RHS repeat-associated protein
MSRSEFAAFKLRPTASTSIGTFASLIIAGFCLIGLGLPSAAAAAECTDTWIGPSVGAWETSKYWSTESVPTSSDVACVGSGKTVYVTIGAHQSGSVQGLGELILISTLSLESTTNTSDIANLTIEGGGLEGPGDLNVSGELNWNWESIMSGPGSTVLLPGATGVKASSGYARLQGRDFINEGAFTIAKGTMIASEGAEIFNNGTFTTNGEATAAISSYSGGGPFFNTGTLQKTAGSGTTEIGSIFLENDGVVDAESGKFSFSGGGAGTESSQWQGQELRFRAGTYSLAGASLSAAVTPEFFGELSVENLSGEITALTLPSGGSMSVTGSPATIDSLSMEGGVLKGPGTVNVSNELTWVSESKMEGLGSTVLLAGGTGSMNISGSARLEKRAFVNEGTFTLTHGIMLLSEGAEVVNEGTFNANGESTAAIESYGGGGPVVNRGVFQKTSGTGSTYVLPNFENLGIIKEGPGHLVIPHKISRSSSEHLSKECFAADPVNCATGDLSESQTDIAIGGLGVGLDLTRTYSAQAAAAAGSPGIFGYGWSATFSDHLVSTEEGKILTLVSGDGSTVPFTKSGAAYKTPSWSQDTLSGSALAGYTLVLSSQVEYGFSGSGRLEAVTDRNGNETTLAYKEGRLETITDPTGRKITLAFNGGGQIESAEDPIGHLVKYGYESGQLTSVTMPGEAEPRWRFKYDGSHRISQITDGRGGKTKNEYDSSSRVISQTDPAERATTFEYASFHTTITNKATGAVIDEWFTSNHEPFSITRGFGTEDATTETFSYNAAGRLLTKTDGLGHKTTYGYNANGDRTGEKDAAGDEAKWTFNETHDVVSMTTPEGEKTTITRDANGNPETLSRPAPGKEAQTVSFEFGPHGELETLIDPLSHEWTYEYDSQGDRSAQIDPEGDKQTWKYDVDSRLIKSVSPRGNEEGAEAAKFTASIERDPQGRPIKVTDPLGGTTEYEYDPNGNLEVETNPNGHSTTFSYDAVDELTKVERPDGDIEETGYDGAGEVTSQTDGNKGKTTYVRNVLEQPIETIDPLERVTAAEFDAAGNLKSKTDPEERTTSYAYDAADRLKEISYSDGVTPTATFGYDKDSNLTAMKDGTGESSFEFDQLDRLTHSEGGHGDTVGYEYNLGDEQIGLTYPNGKSISREFDDAGRLESLSDWLGHKTSFAYNNDSALKATTFPSGTGNVDEYGYDRADLMSSVAMKKGAETLASLSYTRDKAGQLESLVSAGLPGAEEEEFSYDENERLTNAGSEAFKYDAANNLTEAPGTSNSYDKASQLEAATGASFSFDEEGERTKRTPSAGPATTYKYDQAGDLTAVERAEEGETPAISESYAYDGSGLLAARTVGLSTRYLTWNASASLPLLLADGENSYIYGPAGNPVEQISSGESPTYLHHDQLGSTRLLTNAAGEVSGSATFSAYGAPAGKSGSTSSPLGFDGQYTLGQSGLIYLRARFYEPGTGQFISRDPAEEVTRSPYFYGGDNPLRYSDRTGLSTEVELPCWPFCEPPPIIVEPVEEAAGAINDAASAIEGLFNEIIPHEESSDEAANAVESRSSEDCPDGDALRRKGEELLGRGHSKAGRGRFNDWWKDRTPREKKAYGRAGGPRPRKGG